MMKFRLTYICLLAGLLLGSCSDVIPVEEPAVKEDRIVFSASNAMMITRSGLEYEDFEVGTKYLLYGVEAAGTYDWANAVMNKRESYETDKHLINYGPDLHFREKTYDFYGATICSTGEEYPVDNTADDRAPVISLNMEDNQLDDLMYSNTLKGCTRTSGQLQMNFIHALSKIQVEVSKQNESGELAGAKIHSITLQNTYSSGTLDIVGGSWTLSGDTERIFSETPVTLSTSATMIKDKSGTDAEMLIFPNEDNSKVSLEIVYSIGGGAEKSVVCEILEHDGSAFLFKQNHRYTLSVAIANDGIQIVTVLPKVYEWIDIDVESYLGQPVTFGNLMWMDRNLGAISADYENDWYNTIGHYFQFGRNIPFILDVDKFKEYTGDGYLYGDPVNFENTTMYVMKYRNRNSGVENQYYYDNDGTHYTRLINAIAANGYSKRNGVAWNSLTESEKTVEIRRSVECIYTYDHKGEKVYGIKYVEPDNPEGTTDAVVNKSHELVRNPNRIKEYSFDLSTAEGNAQLSELYKFGFGTKQPGTPSNLKYPTVWTFNNSCGRFYWQPDSPEYDPCPKGWRLPSKTDLEVLMPTVQINWNDQVYPQTATTETEDIRYGKYTEGNDTYHVCYILKNKGQSNAYRLRIMSHYTNDSQNNKRYFSIARYGAEPLETNLDNYLDGTMTSSSKETQMWANPIEIIKYPACGFIVPDSDGTPETVHPDLRSFGFGTVIRTSDSNPEGMVESSNNGFNFVQYLSTTDYQLGIQSNSRRSLGDQIRCVRDINAID